MIAVRFGSASPKIDSVSPYGIKGGFVEKTFVVYREIRFSAYHSVDFS